MGELMRVVLHTRWEGEEHNDGMKEQGKLLVRGELHFKMVRESVGGLRGDCSREGIEVLVTSFVAVVLVPRTGGGEGACGKALAAEESAHSLVHRQ